MSHNRHNEHCAPVARPGTTARVPLVLTRRELLWLGWGSVGVGSALLVDALLSPKVARSVPVKALPVTLRPFHFDVVTVNAKGQVVSRQPGTAKFFTESLGKGVGLDMVSIPGGSFVMGSPIGEKQRIDWEGPPHRVTVPSFFMGKYAVTQAQWQAVAALPKLNHDLKPNPSEFKGTKRPIERVDDNDAREFCDRLSRKTGRQYRLPSEAEWEYACRAGTTTPFHFGETLTTALANYNGRFTYASEPQGDYRRRTTDVGNFPPNAFGLYDLHGNVWEWCADHWHDNYYGAPTDGSAWVTGGDSEHRVVRGGSWVFDPGSCRSAFRIPFTPGYLIDPLGFRVVCAAP